MIGELLVVDDVPGAFVEHFVDAFEHRLDDQFAFAASGGSTARRCYERLAAQASDRVDWMAVDLYWGDERCVPLDDEDSNARLIRDALLSQVGGANEVHPMRCEDGPEEYQLKLSSLGLLDVVHLGVGPDGHVASLFPDSPALYAPGRLVVRNTDPKGNNKHQRLTLTFDGISRSRLVLVTVEGESKQDAVRRLLAGEDIPANRVHSQGQVIWLIGRDAMPKSA